MCRARGTFRELPGSSLHHWCRPSFGSVPNENCIITRMLEASSPAFAFGENWSHFLTSLSDRQIEQATGSVSALVGRDLRDKTFLDIGSGSGLSSLAARRLGARVYSFDYDLQSVAC